MNVYKYIISWGAGWSENGPGPTQTAWALVLAVNKDYVFPFQGHAHSHKKAHQAQWKKGIFSGMVSDCTSY